MNPAKKKKRWNGTSASGNIIRASEFKAPEKFSVQDLEQEAESMPVRSVPSATAAQAFASHKVFNTKLPPGARPTSSPTNPIVAMPSVAQEVITKPSEKHSGPPHIINPSSKITNPRFSPPSSRR